jgi:acyl dehydratase
VARFENLAALAALIGTPPTVGEWVTIDQKRIDLFADATGDHQWIHVDPARAATGPFGGTIAHGYLTLSLIPELIDGLFEVGGVELVVNYGLNRVRFLQPVPVNSRVRASTEVVSLEESSRGRLLTQRITVEIEGLDKPALVAVSLALFVTAG